MTSAEYINIFRDFFNIYLAFQSLVIDVDPYEHNEIHFCVFLL